ncbi:MAG: DUF2062 domain-containing protein [Gammaproteobacteria bacterium]|nr:DUF2062 domain-containing protein [Gammaproteobacteria bacterium]
MPKKLLKRLIPDQTRLRNHQVLSRFGTLLHHPNLWHMNRHSVPGSIAIGLFIAFLPLPFHMLLAAALAVMLRVNIPLAVATVWINNPVTIAPVFYFAYHAGAWIMQIAPHDVPFEMTFNWLTTTFARIWQPFLIGCLLLSLVSAILGYLLVRALWVWQIRRSWQQRRQLRRVKSRG